MATKSKPPVTGGTHPLPVEKLAPLEFERLCLWLVEREGFERAEALGQSGSEKGQDLRAWRGDRRFVFQCKRVREFAAATGKKEIAKLRRELSPAEQPHELVFVVTVEVSAGARAAIGAEWGDEATCHFWAGVELDQRMKRHPEIVREFFQLPSEAHSPLRQLPAPPADFVGRKKDLAELRRAIKKGGATICGLQGQGGVGKTALATAPSDRGPRIFGRRARKAGRRDRFAGCAERFSDRRIPFADSDEPFSHRRIRFSDSERRFATGKAISGVARALF